MDPGRRRTDRSGKKEKEDDREEARAASFTLHTDMIITLCSESLSGELRRSPVARRNDFSMTRFFYSDSHKGFCVVKESRFAPLCHCCGLHFGNFGSGAT